MTKIKISDGMRLERPRGSRSLGAWFLGPLAENEHLLHELAAKAISSHADARREAGKHDPDWSDPEWIDKVVKNSSEYKSAERELREGLKTLLQDLKQSVPFFSYRYQGHML